MTILDLFSSGFNTRNQDHFASIVRVAMTDGVLSDEEKAFLDRLAQKLDISKEMYARILKDYKTHPINPPVGIEKRIERLYDLTRMLHIDPLSYSKKKRMLSKLAVGLGFVSDSVPKVVTLALKLVNDNSGYKFFEHGMHYFGDSK